MSEAPKHTPGPWVALQNSRNIHQVAAWICTIGNNPGDPAVFSTVFDTEKKYVFGDKLADAHLIAAAPEMLEALKEIASATRSDVPDGEAANRASEIALAAIAKAEARR